MAYTPWNPATPIGSEPAATIDEIIVEVKGQVAERGDDLTDVGGKFSTDDPVLLSKTSYNPFVGLENLQYFSVGESLQGTGGTLHTSAGGTAGTAIVGVRPIGTGTLLIWQMPVVLAPGYVITGYKGKVHAPGTPNGFVEMELFKIVYGADGVPPATGSLGSVGPITGPGFKNIEITGLSYTVLNTESYFAEFRLQSGDASSDAWVYAGGPVYDALDLASRL